MLRNVFCHWKSYVVHKLQRRKSIDKAYRFYREKLQKKVFNGLSKNVLSKWEHIVSSINKQDEESIVYEVYEKAGMHYIQLLLKKYFRYWRTHIEIANEKKNFREKIFTFHKMRCLRKCIKNWQSYVLLQKENNIMEDKIDKARKFYDEKILQNCLRDWFNDCDFTLREKEIQRAVTHYENKLLIKYFYRWKGYHIYKQEKLKLVQCAITYNKKRLLKKYFEQYITSVNECIREKVANEEAEIFYNSKLIRKVFSLWQEWCSKKAANVMKICKFRDILENRKTLQLFIKWRLYVTRKKSMRRKTYTAKYFHEKKLATKALRKFHDYILYRRRKRIELSYLDVKREEVSKHLQIIYIDKWRKELYYILQEKRKLRQATKFWESKLIRKYFHKWKESSLQYKLKRICKKRLDEIAEGFILKEFIAHWRARLQDVLAVREKETLAISLVERKIIKEYFSCWKKYTNNKIKMTHDITAALELYTKFWLREGLKTILRNSLRDTNYQRDLQLETATLRLFKNMEILKEYFDKWYALIYARKGKLEDTRKVTYNNSYEVRQIPFNNYKTNLIFPKYMIQRNTTLTPFNSLTM